MGKTTFYAVIGKNFGDEGKGLVTNHLCSKEKNTLVVRHNGGAQSGHTVVNAGRRFVFHELSSGSFCGADTFWADTYHPDLYKLKDELEDFKAVAGFVPLVLCSENAGITIIDDILINMAAEESRKDKRHGSCGMGIYECELREKAGFKVTALEAKDLSADTLLKIRREYLPKRLKELGLDINNLGEYGEMLKDSNVVINFANQVKENASLIQYAKLKDIAQNYSQVVFENGQGLLLDGENERFLPNVTGSRTGLTNINQLMEPFKKDNAINVIYVSRSYVTRHGAGLLPCECKKDEIGNVSFDRTNIHNDWQGTIRYGKHESIEDFMEPVEKDLKEYEGNAVPFLYLTHLNETDGKVVFSAQNREISQISEFKFFKEVYKSFTEDMV